MLRLHQPEPVPQTPAMDPAQALQTQLFCKKHKYNQEESRIMDNVTDWFTAA